MFSRLEERLYTKCQLKDEAVEQQAGTDHVKIDLRIVQQMVVTFTQRKPDVYVIVCEGVAENELFVT